MAPLIRQLIRQFENPGFLMERLAVFGGQVSKFSQFE